MSPFELDVLLWPASAIYVLTLLVTFYVVRSIEGAILAASAKAGLFLIYFNLVFDGTFTFVDDWNYLEGGRALLAQDVHIYNLADNWEIALTIGEGDHFMYYLYNAYAFRIFGDGYFAPVACNILITVLIAFFGTRLVERELRLPQRSTRWFYIFVLFHPDILAWSNVMNGKDILVLFLHVLLLTSVSFYFLNRMLAALLLAVPAVLVLFFLRFYVPLLFATALVATTVTTGNRSISSYIVYFALSCFLLIAAYFWVGASGIQNDIEEIRSYLVNPLYGFGHMLLTPIPFNADDEYEFLNFPMVIHWLLIPIVGIGVVRVLSMQTLFSRFMIIYMFLFLLFYAVYGELQGPRHRVQLDYLFAVLQFLGLLTVVGINARKKVGGVENQSRTAAERRA